MLMGGSEWIRLASPLESGNSIRLELLAFVEERQL